MGAHVAEPEPELSLSTTHWDPADAVLSAKAVAVAQAQIEAILRNLATQRMELEEAGPGLGLIRGDAAVAIPKDWAQTPGSPVYYLRVAEGFVRAAAQGTICRDDFPESEFKNVPPPPDHWLCGHEPPHPRLS